MSDFAGSEDYDAIMRRIAHETIEAFDQWEANMSKRQQWIERARAFWRHPPGVHDVPQKSDGNTGWFDASKMFLKPGDDGNLCLHCHGKGQVYWVTKHGYKPSPCPFCASTGKQSVNDAQLRRDFGEDAEPLINYARSIHPVGSGIRVGDTVDFVSHFSPTRINDGTYTVASVGKYSPMNVHPLVRVGYRLYWRYRCCVSWIRHFGHWND